MRMSREVVASTGSAAFDGLPAVTINILLKLTETDKTRAGPGWSLARKPEKAGFGWSDGRTGASRLPMPLSGLSIA
jgi:hypothetical protein